MKKTRITKVTTHRHFLIPRPDATGCDALTCDAMWRLYNVSFDDVLYAVVANLDNTAQPNSFLQDLIEVVTDTELDNQNLSDARAIEAMIESMASEAKRYLQPYLPALLRGGEVDSVDGFRRVDEDAYQFTITYVHGEF